MLFLLQRWGNPRALEMLVFRVHLTGSATNFKILKLKPILGNLPQSDWERPLAGCVLLKAKLPTDNVSSAALVF
jgi:hypothetical protein